MASIYPQNSAQYGVQQSGGLWGALKNIAALPGALLGAGQAAGQASNAQAAASGQSYTSPQHQGVSVVNPATSGQVQSSAPLGSLAIAPKPSTPSNTLPSNQSAPAGGSSIDYTLHNGESIAAYNARIAAARGTQDSSSSSSSTPTNTSGTSAGLGSGGGAAPAGSSYNAQGQIVPNSSLPTNQPPQTFNTNPYNASAPTYGGLIGSLAGTASQPSAAFTQAQQQAQQALSDLTTSRQNEASALSLNAQNPIPLEFQQGRGNILQNQYLQQQTALAQEYSGATAQMGAATGQQGVQQSGLGAAAGLAGPQSANALGTFNPVTGQYSQYGGGSGSGAAGAGAVGQQMAQGAAVQDMTGKQAQAQALAQNLNGVIQQAGINPFDTSALTTFANGALQSFMSGSGDPKYQNFNNLINEISSRYASILNQSGGTPTDQSTLSHNIINALASGKSIQEVLQSLDKNASDSINALKGAASGNAVSGGQSNTDQQSSNFYSKDWFKS